MLIFKYLLLNHKSKKNIFYEILLRISQKSKKNLAADVSETVICEKVN